MPSNTHLTEEQRIAIDVLDRAMALTAGAGSGKTTVLVERYAALVHEGVKPEAILCVTFTNEAASELKERIIKRLVHLESSLETIAGVENSPWVGTIHSFCYTLLETYGSVLGLPGIEEISEYYDLSHLFQNQYTVWFESLGDETFAGLLQYFSARELKEMAEKLFFEHFHFSEAVSKIQTSPQLEHRMVKRLHHLFSPLFKEIENKLHQRGAFTFNDLETLTLKLLERNEMIRERLKAQFQSLLIDEFQDTSRLQWKVLHSLLDDAWKKLFVVGDPKQSIYGFRNADVSLFKEVSRAILDKGGIVQELTLNFRTQGTLLGGINTLSQSLFDNTSIPFSAMKEGRTENGPDFQLEEYILTEDLDRKEAQEVELKTTVKQVRDLQQRGESLNQVAVLFRNGDRLKEYQDALALEGIPSVTHASQSLFDHDEILDIGNFLSALEDPFDDFSLGAFLRSSFIQMPPQTLALYRSDRETPLLTALLANPPPELNWFFALLETGEANAILALEALFQNTQRFPNFREGFLSLLGPLSKARTLKECVERFKSWKTKAIAVEVGQEEVTDAVRLMTVHSAKGLEFDHVLLTDALRQMPYGVASLLLHGEHPPGLRYKKEGEIVQSKDYEMILEKLRRRDAEEAKRILYVAMTRARETLTLILPKNLKALPKGSWALLLREAMQGVLFKSLNRPL